MDVSAKAPTAKGHTKIHKTTVERKNLWLGLAGWLFLCYSASVTGDFASAPYLMGWYNSLHKPFFTPGGDFLRPVWTILYTTMAFSAWRLWMVTRVSVNRGAFFMFFLQLALNMAWPFIFFDIRDAGFSFISIIVLLSAIVGTIYMFRRIDQMASYLLYPYVLWVCFMTVIMGEIWATN